MTRPADRAGKAAADRALLLFCDATGIGWLRWLRPGFRHVFIALPDPDGWIIIDPLSTRMEVTRHPAMTEPALTGWFIRHGVTVLAAPRRQPVRPGGLVAPLSCVAVAKRLLGLHAPLILTPWQLYRHLGGPPPPFCPSNRRNPMARLVSAPKPRAADAPPAVPLPAPPTPLLPSATATAEAAAEEGVALTAGERSLLRRAGGRAGTVLTGWRGILAPGTLAPTRKSLLGE